MSLQTTDQRQWGYDPEIVLHPGETLRERLEEIGMDPSDLAAAIGVPPEAVDQILRGAMPVHPELSPLLESVTGTPARVGDRLTVAYCDHLLRKGAN